MVREGTSLTQIPYTRKVFYALYANLPITGVKEGDLGYATDRLVVYRWSGAAWQPVSIHSSSGLAADIPAVATLPNGSLYFATDDATVSMVVAGAWVVIASTPTIPTTIILKTASQTVNNSIVLVNDNHLFFAVAANEVWELLVYFRMTTASVNPDIDYAFAIPVAATIMGLKDWSFIAASNEEDLTAEHNIPLAAGGIRLAMFRALYIGGANAGNVQLQWAQNVAVAENTQMLINSFIIAHQLA